MTKSFSFLFPAFGNELSGNEHSVISHSDIDIEKYILSIKNIDSFDINNIDTELKSQYLVYLYSCIIADILKNRNIKPNYIVGYSMGIYAALYAGGSIEFTTGIKIIKEAHKIISTTLLENNSNTQYAMASINGLDRNDIEKIIKITNKNGKKVEIINENSKYSFVISGIYDNVNTTLKYATDEGAISAKFLPIELPYHSKYLKKAEVQLRQYLQQIDDEKFEIKDSKYTLISCIDQRKFVSKTEIIKEVSNNISNRINWHKSMITLIENDQKHFIECGSGKTLNKISKFINGEFEVFPFYKFTKYLDLGVK